MRSAKISARLILERRSSAVMVVAGSLTRPALAGMAEEEAAGGDTVDSGTRGAAPTAGGTAMVKTLIVCDPARGGWRAPPSPL